MSKKRTGLAERVRELRQLKALNLRGAEAVTGVSRSMLSKIERGVASPTATLLGKLAEGFGVSISQLLGGPAAKRRVVILRRGRQTIFRDSATGFERRSLAPVRTERGVDLVVNILPPGATSGTFPAHRTGVEETLAVGTGRLWLFLDGRKIALGAGDSVFYRANVAHRFKNPSRTEAAVFYIVIDHMKAV